MTSAVLDGPLCVPVSARCLSSDRVTEHVRRSQSRVCDGRTCRACGQVRYVRALNSSFSLSDLPHRPDSRPASESREASCGSPGVV